jgi:hypothetical protein
VPDLLDDGSLPAGVFMFGVVDAVAAGSEFKVDRPPLAETPF